jgi:hypothetical protein
MGILSNTIIAITGTLPAETNQIMKWVIANGGKWSARVEPRVTHLLASKDAWTRVTDSVKKAAELKIHVLSYDWLEDSLQGKRKLAEKKYTWEAIKREKKKKRQLKRLGAEVDSKKFIEGCKKIKELTGSGTSAKLPPERKPKPSKSFFFAETINSQFVSAKDALMQRRAAREAAEAEEKAKKAAKKASAFGTAQAPITIDNGTSCPAAHSSMPTPPPSACPTKTNLKHSASDSLKPSANDITAGTQAKKPSLKDLYHYYLDSTGFEYKVIVARSDFSRNQITRYQIAILESHTSPHTYCTFVQYAPPIGAPPKPTDNASDAKVRTSLLDFLRQGKTGVPITPANIVSNDTHPQISQEESTRLRALITPKQDLPIHPTEQVRLNSLITPPTPAPTTPYKTLICPMNSPFAPAWLAFRHVFRDLTLLSWEERFDPSKTTQTLRAKTLNIEPYIYSRPSQGMPIGLSVQEAGMFQAHSGDFMAIRGDAEDGYVRNQFGLPGIDEELGKTGIVGRRIWRQQEDIRKEARVMREREEERAKKEKERTKEEKRKVYQGPLFNGPLGRPRVEEMRDRPVVKREEGAVIWTKFPVNRRSMYSRDRG